MLKDIWQEIGHLNSDRAAPRLWRVRKFVRNMGLVTMISLLSSCSLVLVGTSSQRLAQQEKLERLSNLMSVGICIRTQMILRQ